MQPSLIDTDPSRQPPKFYGEYGKLRPQGVKQGQIGDCWFLAAASALAEKPSRMDDLINEKNRQDPYNSAGIFRFTFWV